MEKKITKTAIRKEILDEFYLFIEKQFKGKYIIDEPDVDVYFVPTFTKEKDSIQFRRSSFSLCTYNWADKRVQEDEKIMQKFLNDLIELMEIKYDVKFK